MKHERQQTVLVTGASQGIGASVARAFAEQGYLVVLCARNLSKLEALAAEIGGHAYALDVSDGAAVEAVIDRIERDVGPIDILISNAGVAVSATLTETTDDDWAKMIGVNLTGGFYLCRRLLPGMAERGFGRIIFVASNAGLIGYPYTSGYCASKHGTIGFMRSLAVEYARENLTVNAICPGFVETEMAQGAIENITRRTGRSTEKARGALERLNPQRRLIQCDEVAHLALSLSDSGARGINGQAIALDGGQVQH
jgi:NAD(P)-dependent dehydrogenase (short-subunit alcohol dehydrogenase family)